MRVKKSKKKSYFMTWVISDESEIDISYSSGVNMNQRVNLSKIQESKRLPAILSGFDCLDVGQSMEIEGEEDLRSYVEMLTGLHRDEIFCSPIQMGPIRWMFKVERISKESIDEEGCCGCCK